LWTKRSPPAAGSNKGRMTMLIDTHAHLDDQKFDDDRAEVIKRAEEAGVAKIINIGYDLPSSRRVVDMLSAWPGFYAAVGVHPHDAATYNPGVESEIRRLASRPGVVAVGEIGLDYYRNLSPAEVQRRVFRRQIGLAREVGLPIVVHEREACADTLRILAEEKAAEIGGVMHCFSGSRETAKICLDMGFYISFAGPVTFKNARRLQEVAGEVPLDRLLVETDCPYLTPEPWRGKRNEPAYVKYVAQRIAAIRGLELEDLAQAVCASACRLFRL
jgi:TatD DNase family protein